MEERVAMAVMMTEAMARVGKLQARLQGMLRWAGRRARQGEGAAPSRDTTISIMCSSSSSILPHLVLISSLVYSGETPNVCPRSV